MGMRAALHQALEATMDDASGLDPSLRGRTTGGGKTSARTRMLKGLRATRGFSRGAKSGGSAKGLFGRDLPSGGLLDTRQRVIVKAHIAKHKPAGFGSGGGGGALRAHVRYLECDGRDGAERGEFYDHTDDRLDGKEHVKDWADDRHHFRFIVSPEHGREIDDFADYVRDSMDRVARDLGEPKLDWIALNHDDTDQPHAHVLVRGVRADGRPLVIPREYMAHGFRSRFQEAAQERLGELSREAAHERARRQMTQGRWTDIDRHLERGRDERGHINRNLVRDRGLEGELARGRLQHLEALELAEKTREGWRLAADLKQRLQAMALEKDILRQMHRDMQKTRDRDVARDHAREAEREARQAQERIARQQARETERDAQRAQERAAREQAQMFERAADRPERSEERDAADRGAEFNPEISPEVSAERAPERSDVAQDLSAPSLEAEARIYERRLIDLDWDIQHRWQAAAGLRSPDETPRFDEATEQAIAARGRLLVENGLAIENEFGVSLTFEGWRELQDNDVARAIEQQLGIDAPDLKEAFGSRSGMFLGCVETQNGLFAIAERSTGDLIYGRIDHVPEIEIGVEVSINSSKELVKEAERGLGLEL